MSSEDDFDEFYRARSNGLMRSLQLAFGDAGRAEDATQEAFVRAWQRWSKLDADPIAWTRRVAWRLYVDDWRRSHRRLLREHRADERRTQAAPELDEALSMLQPLNREQRAVMVLYYVEDMSVEDVADVLGVSVGTVKSRMSRARDVLRIKLDERSRND